MEKDKTKLLSGKPLVCERRVFENDGNTELELLMYYGKKPTGCIISIHGGGWGYGSTEIMRRHSEYFADNGAVGVSIPYRLLSEKTDIRDGISDCLTALEFVRKVVRERWGAMPITVMGDSAGGYYAVCLGCQKIINRINPGISRADFVVDLNGIVNLTGKWNYGIIEKENDIKTKDVLLTDFSPIFNVSETDAPVLIVHGDRDETVSLSDAVDYNEALNKHNVKNELIILDGAAHAFILFDYRHDNAYVATILTKITRYLKNKNLI